MLPLSPSAILISTPPPVGQKAKINFLNLAAQGIID